MKQITFLLLLALLCGVCFGCAPAENAQVAATTLPVYQFTAMLCENTPISVTRLVTEEVSCLHDYTLTVRQMKAIEGAELVVISGAGLEEFLEEALGSAACVVDASTGAQLLEGGCHHHDHDDEEHHDHHHEMDAHIWLSPRCAMTMAQNICDGLCSQYPQYSQVFQQNLTALLARLEALDAYARDNLSALSTHEIITFHDGFAYLAHEYGIEILEAIEEESGAEASAQELIHLVELVRGHNLPAIFVERSGSGSAASVIAGETGLELYTLDMAMAGDDYFASMYHNIDTLKEALG